MSRLLVAEVRRLWSRRVYRIVVAAFLAGFVVSGTMNYVTSNRNLEAARLRAAQDVQTCRRMQSTAPDAKAFDCPTVEQLTRDFDPRFDFAATMKDANRAGAIMMLVAGFVLGASFVGAEWSAGTMTTLLAWEPRRAHVMGAKLVAAAAVMAATAVVLVAALTLAHFPAAALRGTTSGTTARYWWSLAGMWLRSGSAAALGSWIGVGLAMLTRNTAGAVGAGLVYVAFVDPVLASWRRGRLLPWLLQHNVPQFLGIPVADRAGHVSAGATHAGVLLSAYVLAAAAAGYAAFRMRDVT